MTLLHESVVLGEPAEVFAWHERVGALPRLLPPWQPVRVIEEARSLRDGRAVLRLPGGVRWVAQHSGYEPPLRFVDDLVSLPLRWHHVHTFEADSPTSTRVIDTVDTAIPSRLVARTFRYRHRQLADDLVTQREMARRGSGAMTVAVTGSSGLVGSALCALLTTGGHRVIRLVRRAPERADERQWRPGEPDPEMLVGTDAVVHLAGASIAGRFGQAHKRRIEDSRVAPTARLAEAMARATNGPKTLVAASAIGFYGAERGNERLDETTGPGQGFLAEVVERWESAARPALTAGIRVVHLRTGIVQSPRGGVLRLLRPLFEAGLGGPVGGGHQWLSWIDLDDLTDAYYLALVDPGLSGPVNAVAPHPVTNAEFATTLARVLRRPSLVAVPALGLRLILGQDGARELALASQWVSALRLTAAGFAFRRPTLEACLRHQLGA